MKFQPPIPNFALARYPKGSVVQFWGENKEMYMNAVKLNGHPGLDILPQNLPYAKWHGSPLLSCIDGKVTSITVSGNIGGNEVAVFSEVENGKAISVVFSHCKETLVKVGQKVKAGDLIATMGNTGFVVSGGVAYWGNQPPPDQRGTHLHLTVREYSAKPIYGSNGNLLNYEFKLLNSNNGLGGAVDPVPYLKGDDIMTNGAIAQIEGSPELAGIIRFTHPEALASYLLLTGQAVPRDTAGQVDFTKVKIDYILKPIP